MIPRYSTKEMEKIWSTDNKYKIWLIIEILACEIQEKLGNIPKNTTKKIIRKASFEEKRIQEGEGFNINYPMPPNTSYAQWKISLEKGINEIERFNPDFLLISLGVDTFENYPISFFKLKSNDFTKLSFLY